MTNPLLRRGSLRLRLLGGTIFWIVISIMLAGWGLGKLFHQHLETQFYAELNNHLAQLTAQLELDEQARPELQSPLVDPRLEQPFSGLYWQIEVYSSNTEQLSKPVLRSRSLWDEILQVPMDRPADGELHRHRISGPQQTNLRVVERVVIIDEHNLRLIVAADENLLTEPIADFKGYLWLALGMLGTGLGFAALMQVAIGLAPLRSLQRSLALVQRGKTVDMEGGFPSEIMPLVKEFNSVLQQNTEMVERARTQAGNLAHALKTPLTILANTANSPARQNDEFAQLVRTQIETMRQQIDYQLTRAQTAASVRLPGIRTAVVPVIQGLIRLMQRVYAESKLEFVLLPTTEPLVFRGEEQDLQEMLGNLLDNAAKWATSRIEISLHSSGEMIEINIDDDGHGIADHERQKVLQRGVRADERTPGSGLGLAIVEELTRLYDGQLKLEKSRLGGLKACLQLPEA